MTLNEVIEKAPKHVHAPWVTAGLVKSAADVLETETLAKNWKWFSFPSNVKYSGWRTESGQLAIFYQLQTHFSSN